MNAAEGAYEKREKMRGANDEKKKQTAHWIEGNVRVSDFLHFTFFSRNFQFFLHKTTIVISQRHNFLYVYGDILSSLQHFICALGKFYKKERERRAPRR